MTRRSHTSMPTVLATITLPAGLVVLLFFASCDNGHFPHQTESGPDSLNIWWTVNHIETVDSTHVFRIHVEQDTSSVLPAVLARFPHLWDLDWTDGALKDIPPSIGTLVSIQFLTLSRNRIKSISSEIKLLPKLCGFSADSNQITSVPGEMCGLRNLGYLDLNNNPIDRLPDSISNWVHLRSLDIRYTRIGQAEYQRIKAALPWAEIKY